MGSIFFDLRGLWELPTFRDSSLLFWETCDAFCMFVETNAITKRKLVIHSACPRFDSIFSSLSNQKRWLLRPELGVSISQAVFVG